MPHPTAPTTPALFALLLAACGPSPPMTTDGGSGSTSGGTGTDSTSSHTSTGATSTGAAPTSSTTTGGALSSTSSTTATDTGDSSGGFIIRPEVGNCVLPPAGEVAVRCTECDPWTQNCTPGQKCTPYSRDGDDSPESLKCVPIDPNPDHVGDPCTVEGGPASGHDSCDIGALCWGVDEMTLQGTCVGFCAGAPDNPMCPAGASCLIANDGVLTLCLPKCDPLQQDCPGGELCIPNPADPDGFICIPDGADEGGQVFDPCESAGACAPGLVCLPSSVAGECDPDFAGCCTPFCDTTAPNTCPGAMQECLPWYEMGMAPAGLENLGLCAVPA